jgi:hypothetical protein
LAEEKKEIDTPMSDVPTTMCKMLKFSPEFKKEKSEIASANCQETETTDLRGRNLRKSISVFRASSRRGTGIITMDNSKYYA